MIENWVISRGFYRTWTLQGVFIGGFLVFESLQKALFGGCWHVRLVVVSFDGFFWACSEKRWVALESLIHSQQRTAISKACVVCWQVLSFFASFSSSSSTVRVLNSASSRPCQRKARRSRSSNVPFRCLELWKQQRKFHQQIKNTPKYHLL